MTDLELATLARIATALEKVADAIEPKSLDTNLCDHVQAIATALESSDFPAPSFYQLVAGIAASIDR
jgi:hypothetical protein